jgi:hypothetical protein
MTVAASNQARQLRGVKFMSRQVFRSVWFSGMTDVKYYAMA